jgi:hypothetical protein
MSKLREFTQNEILTSKAYARPNRLFLSPSQYFKGLLDIEKEKFNITVCATDEEISINDDGTENLAFKRLDLRYQFDIDAEHKYKIGLLIALDKGKPIAKVYGGLQVTTCLNMCIFNAEQIHKFDLDVNQFGYVEFFKAEFKRKEEQIKRSLLIKDTLKSIHLTKERITLLNGAMLEAVLHKDNHSLLGQNPIINGIKLQLKKDSIYYNEKGLNAWLYFNCFTEYLDIKVKPLDIPEKALEVFTILHKLLQFDIEVNEPLILEPKNPIIEILEPKNKK